MSEFLDVVVIVYENAARECTGGKYCSRSYNCGKHTVSRYGTGNGKVISSEATKCNIWTK